MSVVQCSNEFVSDRCLLGMSMDIGNSVQYSISEI